MGRISQNIIPPGPSGNITFGKQYCVYCSLCSYRQYSPLSELNVVLFGFVWPSAYISAGGLYTEAERAAVI